LYKTNIDVVETFNVYLSEINVIKTLNADWMLMRLKEDYEVVSLIK